MSDSLRVLVVEDSVDDTFFIVRELQRGGFEVDFERVETQAAMQSALEADDWDIVICDYSMPLFGGSAALATYKRSGSEAPFIMVSGTMGEDLAVEILKAGAHDYVMKENLTRLVPAVKRELEAAQHREDRKQVEASASYLASIVESCEDAIIGLSLEQKVVSWNTGAERLYGYTAEEMIGRPISVLFPPYRPDELPELMDKVKLGESV